MVRVKSEGIVAESTAGRNDYAILEYSINGSPFTGEIAAKTGDIAITNGINLNLAEASSVTTLVDKSNINNDFGNSENLSGASIGYDGSLDFSIDSNNFRIGEDTSIQLTAAAQVYVAPSTGIPNGATYGIADGARSTTGQDGQSGIDTKGD